ncbi:MAG: high-potential iron-sulfur protein [Agriterribacter sp.]
MKKNCDRRVFVRGVMKFASSFTFVGVFMSCGGGAKDEKEGASAKVIDADTEISSASNPCDVNALTEKDNSNRKALGYVDETPIAEKKCENCKLYVPSNDTKTCGTCPLFKGPVALGGYCTYWADAST